MNTRILLTFIYFSIISFDVNAKIFNFNEPCRCNIHIHPDLWWNAVSSTHGDFQLSPVYIRIWIYLLDHSSLVRFFAHLNEIQLDLTNLTSSGWKHINLLYWLEKRMQRKSSGLGMISWWLCWPPSMDNAKESAKECSTGLQNILYYQWKNSPPATPSRPHICPALLNKFLSLCLDKFYWDPRAELSREGMGEYSSKNFEEIRKFPFN